MKTNSFFRASFAAIVAALALSACGLGTNAYAASQYANEIADNGTVYSLGTVQKIVVSDGYDRYTDTAYGTFQIYDITGAQFARVKLAPAFADFAEVTPGTWVNLKFIKTLKCFNGITTAVFATGTESYSDIGCSAFAGIVSKSS